MRREGEIQFYVISLIYLLTVP